jgi:Ni/Co efflux regulator RcnB
MAQPPDHRGGDRDRGNSQHEQRGDRGGDRGDRGGDRRGQVQPQAQAQPQVQSQAQPAPQQTQPSRNGGFLNYGPMTGITPQTSQQNDRDRRGDNRTEQRAPAAETPRSGFRDSDRDRRDFNRDGNRDGRDFNRGGFDRGGRDFNRNDFTRFNRNFRAPQRYRGPAYVRPRGWYSHRWVFGEILPSLFWSTSYWINDYYYYGLEPPPPGTVWVRDGTDALLIDRFDGQIIQVVYDVFY